MRPLSTSTVATCYYFRSARLVSNKVSVEVVSMQEFMMTTRVNNVCDDTAEDAVHDAVETELVALQTGSGNDELVEMSSRRCWSSRSTGQSWSALVRAGQHGSELVSTGQSWSALVRAGQHWSELVSDWTPARTSRLFPTRHTKTRAHPQARPRYGSSVHTTRVHTACQSGLSTRIARSLSH